MTTKDQGELVADRVILMYLVKELDRSGHLPAMGDLLNALLEMPSIKNDKEFSKGFKKQIEFYIGMSKENRPSQEVSHAAS